MQFENSDVLFATSVAVDVITTPVVAEKAGSVALPAASVTTATVPRNVAPSPRLDASQALLPKYSITKAVFGVLFSVPCTPPGVTREREVLLAVAGVGRRRHRSRSRRRYRGRCPVGRSGRSRCRESIVVAGDHADAGQRSKAMMLALTLVMPPMTLPLAPEVTITPAEPFPSAVVPAALAPMTLLATTFAFAAPLIVMPESRFPEMMFRPATPMRFAGASKMATPSPLPTAVMPDGSVPVKLPRSRLPVVPARLSVMPFRVLPGDHIGRETGAADRVVRTTVEEDAVASVRQGDEAGRIRAEMVALEEIAAPELNDDAGAAKRRRCAAGAETIDGKATDGRVAGSNEDAVAVAPALVPFSSMSGELAYPGCVVASSATGSEIVGSADSGAIV